MNALLEYKIFNLSVQLFFHVFYYSICCLKTFDAYYTFCFASIFDRGLLKYSYPAYVKSNAFFIDIPFDIFSLVIITFKAYY